MLERLRSLRNVHADAAGARERLDEVERNGREMEVEVGKWREALRVVEGRTREVEETVGENVGVVERWVGELEARVRGWEREVEGEDGLEGELVGWTGSLEACGMVISTASCVCKHVGNQAVCCST